ncbi:hypothetical protein E2C01_001631 [Portunus trituberculatus]|uniref:Uncharacterized protein n=1 Tax=Portunus trituberculatus TaxID=210409 RepID=A0A5B7CHS8_PORTR|nr:hypothetical protein [Portunus trituberculatus]
MRGGVKLCVGGEVEALSGRSYEACCVAVVWYAVLAPPSSRTNTSHLPCHPSNHLSLSHESPRRYLSHHRPSLLPPLASPLLSRCSAAQFESL